MAVMIVSSVFYNFYCVCVEEISHEHGSSNKCVVCCRLFLFLQVMIFADINVYHIRVLITVLEFYFFKYCEQ
jgi:hypothetical protein